MKNKIIATAIIIITLASCGSPAPAPKETTETAKDESIVQLTTEQAKNAGVELGRMQAQQVQGNLEVNGIVELAPENVYSISVPMGGFIRANRSVAGMAVQKGTILATIEDAAYIQLQQDYLTARSKVEFFSADYNRQKELYATQSNSQRTFQESKASYEEQKILLKALAEKLKLIGIDPGRLDENNISRSINVLAPAMGYISKVNVNPGKYVNPSDVLFELMNPSSVYLKLSVFENDASALSIGQKVTFYTTANPDEKKQAIISLINRNLDENRTVEVRCTFIGNASSLIPGTFVNAVISMNNRNAQVLPDDGIVTWQGKPYIFVQQEPNTFRMEPVETGVQVNGFTEIKTNIKTVCVTKNAYTLLAMIKNKSED